MAHSSTRFSQQYIAALSRYLLRQDKASLEAARSLIWQFAESGLTSQELSSAYQSALSQALASAGTREEGVIRAKAAAVFLAESLSAFDDISKKTQAALYESREHYRQMFEKNQAVKLLIDPETGAIVDANPAACEFYGYPLPTLRSMKITDINMASPAQVSAEMQRARTERRVYFVFKHRLASGDIRDVEVYSGPIDIQGRRLLSIIHDITERKWAEAELQRAHSELEARVEERTAELAHSNELLKQQIRERERAEESEREQRALAEATHEIVAALNSTLDLNKVLELILDNIGRVVPHDAANIMLLDSGMASIVRQHGYTEYGLSDLLEAQEFVITDMPSFYQMIETGEPLVVTDKNSSPPWNDIPQTRSFLSYVGAPVQLEGEIIGFINLDSTSPNFFSSTHAERLQIFADQAATAIQNARLYQRSRDLAVLEERQRLARDLHDAVSQTLFSASVIAEALPRLWDRDQQEVRRGLDELHLLTRGALAEMRTLLLELRPTALVETGFDELVRQLALAFTSKTRIPVELAVTAMQPLPAPVQIALYRMVQEALNNVAKHARATQVTIQLNYETEQLHLQIKDNGRGFNPDLVSSGRLGLKFMGERANDIGAELRLVSRSTLGTEITILWPAYE